MRRGLGRGRTLIGIGAIMAIVGMPLPWLKVGGVVLSPRTTNGFDGTGVLVFLAAVAMLALIVLPFATRSGRASLDRPAAYLVLMVVGIIGLGLEVVHLLGVEGNSLAPADAPGLWLAAVGMIIAAWGVLELLAERPAAP